MADAAIHPRPVLVTQWFDGRSPQARTVQVWLEGDSLWLKCDENEARYPRREVRWPERSSHGQWQAELPDGSLLQHDDAAEWDQWWRQSGGHESVVVGWQQSWRATVWAVVGSVAFLAAAWVWGVPLISRAAVQLIPAGLEARLGQAASEQLSGVFLKPSALPEAQQEAIRMRFSQLVKGAYPEGDAPQWRLSFHRSPVLGPNAFALPGGYIAMTDELVQLLADQPDAVQGILAHELGHVVHRDGLDMLVRSSLVSALVGVVLGDASGFVATVPATLATQSYSRDAERAADQFAAEVLTANGISPAAMAVFFERIAKMDGEEEDSLGLPIAIGSHPEHDERIRFFREWR